MSRAEYDRWAMGAEQWPHLQAFISSRLAESLFKEIAPLIEMVEREADELDVEQKKQIATECWMFMSAFKDRHDDRQFIRDGFGAHGWVGNDDRGRGQSGIHRLKLVYDVLAASIRRVDPKWRPNR